jgi:hypothetical protein
VAGGTADCCHTSPRAFYQGLSEALATYAQAQFHLAQRLPDGHTRREHYQALARNGRHVLELHPQPLPATCAGVWAVFCELDAERGASVAGACPITSAQLLDWQRLHGIDLSGWEIATIRQLDRLRLNHDDEPTTPPDRPETP